MTTINTKINTKNIELHKLIVISCKTLTVCALAISLSGCKTFMVNLYSNKEATDLSKINTTNEQIIGQSNVWQSKTNTAALTNSGWVEDFNDPTLKNFVKIALAKNPDLKASAARVQANIYNAKAIASNRFPTLDLQLTPSRSEIKTTDPEQDRFVKNTNQNLNVSWEADIWGRLSAERKASWLSAEAEKATYKAAELSLVANVTKAYYNVITNKLSLDISNKQLDSLRITLDIIEAAYKNGLGSALDVYLGRSDIANRLAQLSAEKDTFNQSLRSFHLLLGGYRNSSWIFESALPALDNVIPAGLPSELVARRPDVLASLRRYQSAKFTTLVANKAKLPSFSLTGSYGGSTNSLKFVSGDDLLFNVAGNLVAPIFRGGRLKANADRARLQQDAELQGYVSTLLTAFTEVENGLTSEESIRERIASIEQAVSFSDSAYKLALEQYQSGLVNFNTLLEAQRRWFTADINLLALKNAMLQNRINLYLALGGDFSTAKK